MPTQLVIFQKLLLVNKMQSKTNVGRKLHEIRKQKQLSLRALAERCNLTANAIGKIERSEVSPTINSLEMLADALEIDILEFFFQNTEAMSF